MQSHFIALLHQYTNTFCNKANDLKLQNIPDVPDFWLANKFFCNNLCGYTFMQYYISFLISASLPMITQIIGLSTFFIYFA